MVGNDPALLELLQKVERVAASDASVLIQGETGTGKELIARALHNRSARCQRALVKVNCGAISAGLVESELFGHVKGAFTGALARRVGRFELADGGTIFLDEVGELPPDTQVKLLRVLQEQEFEPLGSNQTVRVNVRVIAATNRDLEEAVKAGRFRADLYYRLNVIPLRCRRCANGARTLRSWRCISSSAARVRPATGCAASPRKPCGSCRNTRGPAICASCRTWLNARWCCPPDRR
ncbi:MAG: sigma-54 factor interaction domain-containing protein [Gammaproteobacteria bacterium]